MPYPPWYFSILYFSTFVTCYYVVSLGAKGMRGGGELRGPLFLFQYSLLQPFMTPSKARKVLRATGHDLCSARLENLYIYSQEGLENQVPPPLYIFQAVFKVDQSFTKVNQARPSQEDSQGRIAYNWSETSEQSNPS
jgi:hypothetical protein